MTGIREERGGFRSIGSRPPRPSGRKAGALVSLPSSKGAVFCIAGMIVGALVGSLCQRAHSNSSSFLGVTTPSASAELRRSRTTPPSLLSSSSSPPSVVDPDPTAPWPRIAWLMSYPNSGTTFTLELVGNASLRYPASNYGEARSIGNSSSGSGGGEAASTMTPVLPGSPIGPFWYGPPSDPSGEAPGVVTRPAVGDGGYVLTKTHCGNRCVMCGPDRYMETQHQFQMHCLATKRVQDKAASANITATMSPERAAHEDERRPHYDPAVVQRAVHLVRSPFDNVVARFRYYQKHHPEEYTRDGGGFRDFCGDLNRTYWKKEEQSTLLEQSILDVIRHVPCHAAFIGYVMWHNYAFTTTRNMRLPTLVVHYQDFGTRLDGTLTELLDFLKLDLVGRPIEFIARNRDYVDYYTDREMADVRAALKELAYLETWQNIERYFPR